MAETEVRILEGHVLDVLRSLPAGSVQTVVTSPPYWGLRDYSRCSCSARKLGREGHPFHAAYGPIAAPRGEGSAAYVATDPDPDCPSCHGTGRDLSLEVVWDGDPACAHEWGEQAGEIVTGSPPPEAFPTAFNRGGKPAGGRRKGQPDMPSSQGRFCVRCGAWRGQMGLEPTPELYVRHVVAVFREVRRVLRADGTLWLNMGDCYAGTGSGQVDTGKASYGPGEWPQERPRPAGVIKPRDLVGMPWRVAFALQADGWWLRSDPIWNKPNPMPESVDGWRWERHVLETTSIAVDGKKKRVRVRKSVVERRMDVGGEIVETVREGEEVPCPGCDLCRENGGLVLRRDSWRPTKAHEYVFLLAPSDTYFADAEAVREPYAEATIERISQSGFWEQEGGPKDGINPNRSMRRAAENLARKWNMNPVGWDTSHGDHRGLVGRYDYRAKAPGDVAPSGRNLRSVWTIASEPYPEAHFATFPRKLVEPCVKAGTSEAGACPECGAPWARVVEHAPNPSLGFHDPDDGLARANSVQRTRNNQSSPSLHRNAGMVYRAAVARGFRRTCVHDLDPVPCVVLDPFGGSGTVGEVARSLGRSAVLVEIKREYVRLAEARVKASQTTLSSFEEESA